MTLDHTALAPLLKNHGGAVRWVVALSGGIDSTVLLHLLWRLRQSLDSPPPLVALHINHGLQDDAGVWAEHCVDYCRCLGIELIQHRVQILPGGGLGPEAAAREARYAAFESELALGDLLLQGHHLDDQVETFFLRLLRGSGPVGLSGIPQQRGLGSGLLLRPLLNVPQQALQDYAIANGIAFVEDPSNADTTYDRNFLRSEVLPLLSGRWPGYRQTINRAMSHLRAAGERLEDSSQIESITNVMGESGLVLASLQNIGADERAARLRCWLRGCGLSVPDESQLREFLRQLEGRGDAQQLLTSQYCVQRFRDGIYRRPRPNTRSIPAAITLGRGENVAVPGVGDLAVVATSGNGFNLEAADTLQVRFHRAGVRCRPAGKAGSSTLKKLLHQGGVPPWWRDYIPLLYIEDELLAVGDLWVCESSRYSADGSDQCRYKLLWDRNSAARQD